MSVPALSPAMAPRIALLLAGALIAAEFALIGTVFKHAIDFECLANWPAWACSGASGVLVALYCMLAALALFAMLRPAPLRELTQDAGARRWPLGLNLAGLALALVPLALLREGGGTAALVPSFAFWTIGMTLLGLGLALFLATPQAWVAFLRGTGSKIVPVLAAGAATPWLATLIRPLWQLEAIADTTFNAVAWTIRVLGYEVRSDPVNKVIGTEDFAISVAPQCSGIEGFALVTIFVTIYLMMFRSDLRFPRALLLYPLGLVASALFNVLRIALLLVIGLEGNPELAVGGFHSHAGWLMFTLVALGIIVAAQSMPALKRPSQAADTVVPPALPLWQDPVAARILPFAAFMLSALAVSVASQTPGALYPWRVLVVVAVVVAFLPIYRSLPWRIAPAALLAGVGIAVLWLAIPVEPATSAPYGALAGPMLLLWYAMRGIGTIVLVPLVEELFFRDYLEGRLRRGKGVGWSVFAALVSATLFAALHDRWIEAFVAGLVLSAVARHRGNICDAIVAHAVANALIFVAAALTGHLALI